MVLAEMLLSLDGSFFSFWGYVLVFGVLFIESAPFIGAFVPGGSILLLLSGILVRLGYFSLWGVIIGAMIIVIIIDILGYFFGRYHPKKAIYQNAKWMLINKEMLEEVGGVVHGHLKKALLFGRINPITRSIASFIIGSERVNFWRFFFYNFLGAAIWIGGFVFVGYAFGNTLSFAETAEEYIILGTIILAGAFYIYCLRGVIKKKEIKNRCKWSNEYGLDCKE
jgi:membrane-associated protein